MEAAPSVDAPRPARRLGLAVLATGCVVGLLGVYAIFVRTRFGQEIDQAALEGRVVSGVRTREEAGSMLRGITSTTLALGVAALASLALVRRRPRLALVPIVAIAGAVVTSEVLKRAVLTRPDLLDEPEYANSFPSGHATIGLAVAWAAVVVAPPAARRPVAAVGTLVAIAIGVAAVAAAWHRPSDIVGGYLVAVAWSAATLATWVALFPDRIDLRAIATARPARAAARYERVAAVLVLAGVGTASGLTIASNRDTIPWVDPSADFIGATIVVAGVAAGLVGALLLASGRIEPRGRLRRAIARLLA